jgi:long-chain fatty acid transport protein
VRAGVARDTGAVEDEYRTPRIPDGDRTWFSAGLGYAVSETMSLDLALTHIVVKDGPVDLKALPAGTTPTTSPNTFRGNLSGSFENSIDIVSVSARFIF